MINYAAKSREVTVMLGGGETTTGRLDDLLVSR